MPNSARFFLLIFAAALLAGACLPAEGRDYADPDGHFAVTLPEGWTAARNPIAENAFVTSISKGGASLEVVTFLSATDLKPSALQETGTILIEAVLQELQGGGEILSKSVTSAESFIAGAPGPAMRCDLEFTSEEAGGGRMKGYMLAVLGKRVAVLVAVSAPASDRAGFQAAETALRTLAIEARSPSSGQPPSKVQPLLAKAASSGSNLSRVAQQFGGKARRDGRSKVLCAGEPPLTYGSVADFAELVGECFSIQLTENEFEATKQRFVEYYQKADPQGKAVLAQGWGKLLSEIRSSPAEQRDASLKEVRAVMEDRFRTGAQAGIGYAAVMVEAIDKRSKTLAAATGQKPHFAKRQGFDSDFSQADLEAALEMLYFMWVASGRDASLVTADAVAEVQTALVTGYITFPSDLQYVLCNAKQIYAGLRAQWEGANDLERLQMAQAFGQQLDSLGFTLPSPGRRSGSGSAWSDWEGKSHAQFAGEMVVGLAGSSYKSAW